jgi:conjugative transfer signal peptidase TraF
MIDMSPGARSLIVVSFLFAIGIFVAWIAGYRVNVTSSYPLGIWRLEANRSISQGSLVLLCPPDTPLFQAAKGFGVLRAGGCPGGYAPLLKRLAAGPGDFVEVQEDGVSVNGRLISNSLPLQHDSQGQTLPRTEEKGWVPDGEAWFLSDYNPRSFDSRYFGPVSMAQIQGTMVPVWISQ